MTGHDERRDVARRLRELPDDSTYLDLICSIDDHDRWYAAADVADRLADLIEPVDRNDELCAHCDYRGYCDLPKCSEQDGYSFRPKGYVDLLVLADKTIANARNDMEVCGDTVPSWYAAGRLKAVARSIREILGVES